MKTEEIKEKLSELDIPETISLDSFSQITNSKLFIKTHLGILDNPSMGERVKRPYKDRLIKLITILQ